MKIREIIMRVYDSGWWDAIQSQKGSPNPFSLEKNDFKEPIAEIKQLIAEKIREIQEGVYINSQDAQRAIADLKQELEKI